MSAFLDYELRRPYSGELRGVLGELGSEFTMEWERMSPSRLTIQCSSDPLIPALTQIQVAHCSGSRQYIWRGWLARKDVTPTGVRLTFVGPREILRLASVQALFISPTQVGAAFRNVVEAAIAQLSSSDKGIRLADWVVSADCPLPMMNVDLRDAPSAADIVDELEQLAPGYRAVFAYDQFNQFTAKMQKPPAPVLLVQANVLSYSEEYSGITNRLVVLMSSGSERNLVPNGDFSRPQLGSGQQSNIILNPSFETFMANWDVPDPPFYYEWDWNYGYTGTRNFKFHDCAEYESTAWLISDKVPVDRDVNYVGGFAYGCDPYLALECGGPSTVKLKCEVRGYDSSGTYTETPVSMEIAGADKFHAAFHWHWVEIPPFQFTNANTTQAEIRFLTFHGKRLYLDEVQLRKQSALIQEGWEVATSGGATATVDWFKPEGAAAYHYVTVNITAGASQTVELRQTDTSLAEVQQGKPLALRVYYSSLQPTIIIEWRDKNNNAVSSQTISVTNTLYETADGFNWYVLSADGINPPSGAVMARVILRWTNTTGSAFVRAVFLGYTGVSVAPAYGFQPSSTFDSDAVSYPAEADSEFADEALDSVNVYGRLAAKIIRSDIGDNATAAEFAKWFFLRRAMPARSLSVVGAGLEDVRVFLPQLWRWRVPLPTAARSWVVERLVLRHDGSWEAELGEYEPPASELIRKLVLAALR